MHLVGSIRQAARCFQRCIDIAINHQKESFRIWESHISMHWIYGKAIGLIIPPIAGIGVAETVQKIPKKRGWDIVPMVSDQRDIG